MTATRQPLQAIGDSAAGGHVGGTLRARDLVECLADPGSFEAWDEDVVGRDLLGFKDSRAYGERLRDLRSTDGAGEAVLTGRALLEGRPLALVLSEFAFLGGSIGVATGERVVRAFERARRWRWPLLAVTASGGARMQEGVLGFVQMARTTAAATHYLHEGLPFIVYLMNPTMGAVLASHGSLGHVTFAMPGALIGFAGPRAVRALNGRGLPRTVQYSEHLMQSGLVDDVVPPGELGKRVGTILDALAPMSDPPEAAPEAGADERVAEVRDVWASVRASRRPERLGARSLLHAVAGCVTELRGDGLGVDDAGVIVAIARLHEVPVVFLGYDRQPGGAQTWVTPAGLRKARRAMALAEGLRVPLVSVIDTPGAELSQHSEENGLARHIALCLAQLMQLSVPTLSLLLGEGSGGAALALLPADRILAAENAWLAPIAPEGAAAIVYGNPDRAAEVASSQGIASWELARFGIVDHVVSERGGRQSFVDRLSRVLRRELRALVAEDAGQRLTEREARFRFSETRLC